MGMFAAWRAWGRDAHRARHDKGQVMGIVSGAELGQRDAHPRGAKGVAAMRIGVRAVGRPA